MWPLIIIWAEVQRNISIKNVKEELLKGRRFIVIRYDIYTNKYLFLYQYKDYRIKGFFSENLQLLLDMVRRVDEIWDQRTGDISETL